MNIMAKLNGDALMKSITTVSLVALLAMTAISNATAQSPDYEKEIAKCAVITGDLDRLSCFDNFAQSAKLDGPQAQPVEVKGVGKWKVSRDKNPIDDTERVVISLIADSGRSSYGQRIIFVARCQSNKTEAYIKWNNYLGDDRRLIPLSQVSLA